MTETPNSTSEREASCAWPLVVLLFTSNQQTYLAMQESCLDKLVERAGSSTPMHLNSSSYALLAFIKHEQEQKAITCMHWIRPLWISSSPNGVACASQCSSASPQVKQGDQKSALRCACKLLEKCHKPQQKETIPLTAKPYRSSCFIPVTAAAVRAMPCWENCKKKGLCLSYFNVVHSTSQSIWEGGEKAAFTFPHPPWTWWGERKKMLFNNFSGPSRLTFFWCK